MANGQILELASLPGRHPQLGEQFLDLFAPAVIVRLSVDPCPAPLGTMECAVRVDRHSPGAAAPVQEDWRIGWNGMPRYDELYLARRRRSVNDHRLTEDAAVGVMALLIHHLEGVEILEALPIGSGGDYRFTKASGDAQVEVSGIREDLTGYETNSRLREKLGQVLTQSASGFASVTTFLYRNSGCAFSYLHFAQKVKGTGKKGGRKKGGGGKKGRKK
jgi:hypothetical protein